MNTNSIFVNIENVFTLLTSSGGQLVLGIQQLEVLRLPVLKQHKTPIE